MTNLAVREANTEVSDKPRRQPLHRAKEWSNVARMGKHASKQVSSHLGDTHNFGRRVELRGDVVFKPRSVYWEWVFLANESPLRKYLNQTAQTTGLGERAFAFLPDLHFGSPSSHVSRDGSEVQVLTLEPLPTLDANRKMELATIVGRSLALWAWFGVADLHWENLALGVDSRGQIVFSPVDIEMVWADLSLPTETKLLPDADEEYADICRHAAGVRRVLPYLGKPMAVEHLMAIASAYQQMLMFLDRHAREIAAIVGELPALRTMPIRICLRGTEEYMQGDRKSLWPPLLEEEKEQLARGDIPYFFRLYEKPGIHYFAKDDLSEIKTLPIEGDVPQLDPILQVAKSFRSKTRKTLREEGLLTVLGAFDHKSFKGTHIQDGLEITFQKNTLIVKWPKDEEIEAHRDLSEFVGSVYLPCRCGEVLTVFVPKVTVCDQPLGE